MCAPRSPNVRCHGNHGLRVERQYSRPDRSSRGRQPPAPNRCFQARWEGSLWRWRACKFEAVVRLVRCAEAQPLPFGLAVMCARTARVDPLTSLRTALARREPLTHSLFLLTILTRYSHHSLLGARYHPSPPATRHSPLAQLKTACCSPFSVTTCHLPLASSTTHCGQQYSVPTLTTRHFPVALATRTQPRQWAWRSRGSAKSQPRGNFSKGLTPK